MQTVSVTLPAGLAVIVPSSLGIVSTNGLSYSFSGTAAQVQTALRSLQISVPAAIGVSTETLTLTIDGASTTTALKTVSTDTVYVGATDATDGQYATSAIASSLLATGKVGLFTDYNGATAATIAGTFRSLVKYVVGHSSRSIWL